MPAWQHAALMSLQIAAIFIAAAVLWINLIRPRLRTGRFSSEGLFCVALGLTFYQDLMFDYFGNWVVYNAYLLNHGSWAAFVPGWQGQHPENLVEPYVTGLGFIFWFFLAVAFTASFMRAVERQWPRISRPALLILALVFAYAVDVSAHITSVRIGWFAMPGAWREFSLFAGTPVQVGLWQVLWSGAMNVAMASLYRYRVANGRFFFEPWIEQAIPRRGWQTAARFVAFVGITQSIFLVSWSAPMQLQSLHTQPWVEGLPSYFTATCPEYSSSPAACAQRSR